MSESFLTRLKSEMYNERQHGYREKVLVSRRALETLLHHFEDMDAYLRATPPEVRQKHIREKLHHTLRAMYEQQGKDSEATLMAVMDTLRPLMEERQRQRELNTFVYMQQPNSELEKLK